MSNTAQENNKRIAKNMWRENEMVAFATLRHIAVYVKSQLKQQARKLLGDKGMLGK